MRKLSGTDAMFLYNETINTAQHVGSIQYLDVPAERREGFFEAFRAHYLERIHLVPYLTSRLQVTPWDIDHPVWVRHTAFDIDQHLFRRTLPAPGTVAQLEALAAELYEPLMDRSKPMWECWIVDGLENGQIAVIQKIHHACIDGMASVAALELLNDPTPVARPIAPVPAGFWDVPNVSVENLVRSAWENLSRYATEAWQKLPAQWTANARAMQRMMQNNNGQSQPTVAPKLPWNASIDARRSVAGTVMSLAQLKTIAKKTGVKINDVVLGITSDALDRYLTRAGKRPQGSMIAGCPVSLRKPGDTDMNNQVTMISVNLQNDVPDPVARLRAIHESSNAAKALLAELGDSVGGDFRAPFLPAQLARAAEAGRDGAAADTMTWSPMSVVVSNVPGSQVPLFTAGAEIVGMVPMSIVAHGGGLNVTVTSYQDRMELGLTAATKVVPDIAQLRADFDAAYQSLIDTIRERSKPAAANDEAVQAQAA